MFKVSEHPLKIQEGVQKEISESFINFIVIEYLL